MVAAIAKAAWHKTSLVRKLGFLVVLGGFLVVLGLTLGWASILSVGGGIALLAFGSLWPVLWTASLFFDRRFPEAEDAAPDRGRDIMITILAPARNEEPVAERLVGQFLDQDHQNWRLVVIANNCTDDTAGVARRAAAGDPRITVMEATFENGVKADALNLALEEVTDGVVLELDSDNQVPPDLLSRLAAVFADDKVMAVQTQIRAYNARDGLLPAYQDLEFLIYSEMWNRGRAALGLSSSIGGTGFAARASVLHRLGGWTRDLVEDFEMHTRLVAADIKVRYLPSATVYDEKPVTWSALVRQRKRWIRGHLEVAARRTRGAEKLGLIDQLYLYSPVFVGISMSLFAMGYLALAFPGAVRGYAYFSPWFWFVSLGIMVTAVVNVVLRGKDWRLLPLIPTYLLFFTFHWMVVFIASSVPVSWAHSKTVHGVEAKPGVLAWLGLDGWASARLMSIVVFISVAWMAPLFQGLPNAPSPLQAPVLQAGRSVAVAMAGAGTLDAVAQGSVEDLNRRAVPGAIVVVTTASGAVLRTTTSGTGGFAIGGMPVGHVRIDVSAKGYQPASSEFDMPSSGGVWVNVTLATGAGGIVIVPLPY